MPKWVLVTIIAAVALGAGFLAWKIFFPDEEARIIRMLDDTAEAASFERNEPPAAMLIKTRRIEAALDDRVDIAIRVERRDYERIMEKKDIVTAITAGRRAGGKLKIKLSDASVKISGDKAIVEATAAVSYKNGDREFSPQEDATLELVRRDGNWLISRVRLRSFMEK